jgi:serine/threonine protein kinase
VRATGPLRPERVVHVLSQVAGALAEAHGAGLIHRDIKPDNILLTRRGGVVDLAKVVDFGLVKEIETESSRSTGVTHDNAIVGTPLYMAPECIRGAALRDGRSDLYSLGAVAYFLLTGVHVFEGKSVIEICSQHLERAPTPPSQRLGAPIPGDLEAIVLTCLAKEPSDRPSARELQARLARCASSGKWTTEHAEEWWDRHGARLTRREVAIESSLSVAVDIARR